MEFLLLHGVVVSAYCLLSLFNDFFSFFSISHWEIILSFANFQPGTRIEILLLLAKLQYALGDCSGALTKYDEVDLDNVNLENVSNRRLKILAEAYAIKGMKVVFCNYMDFLYIL